jgi:hypothetical protein
MEFRKTDISQHIPSIMWDMLYHGNQKEICSRHVVIWYRITHASDTFKFLASLVI